MIKNNIRIIYLFFYQLIIIAICFLIIEKKGFENRFKYIGLDKNLINLIDNHKYEKIKNDYINKLKFKKEKNNSKKVLIIGNSFANDIFNSLILNKKLFLNYEFKLLNIQIINFSKKDKNEIDQYFENYDYIIFSSKYSLEDINALSYLNKISKNNSKIIIFNQRPMFSQKNNYGGKFSLIDSYIFKNKKIPSGYTKILLEKEYYKDYLNNHFNVRKINKLIDKINIKPNNKIFNMHSLICDSEKKRCSFFFNKSIKIFYDYGHFTIDASRYLGEKIYKTGLLPS